SESAQAQQILCRFAGRLLDTRYPDLGSLAPAKLKRPQEIAHLGDLPAWERIQERNNTLLLYLFLCWRWNSLESSRLAIRTVAFAEPVVLQRECSVIVKRRSPQHRSSGHHALRDVMDVALMAFGSATAQ